MKIKALAVAAACALTSLATGTRAQVPPPPPAAPPPPPPAAAPAPDPLAAEPAPAEPAPAEPPSAEPPAEPAKAEASAGASPAGAAAALNAGEDEEGESAEGDLTEAGKIRLMQRRAQPGLDSGTGIFRTMHAGSGPEGTFRFGFLTSFFSDKAFLCPQCSDAEGGPGSIPDNVRRVGAHVQASATVTSWLEAYLGIHSTATSNTRGDPELLQVLGDSNWGVKVFTPNVLGKTFSVGGAGELILLNGTGGVGVDNTSFALRLLTSLDLENHKDPKDRTPIRFNFNLSYIFDNSGKLVEPIEAERGQPITRIERYGLNINRVDHFTPALGLEGKFGYFHPYLEWSIDVPANRQDYRCAPSDVYASDVCLEKHITFESAPSRATLGTRAYVLLDGLSFNAAFDLGTGGTMPPFWEESQPEAPWMFHFGVAYAVDTKPVVRVKKLPPPPPPPVEEKPDLVIAGVVVEDGTETPIANATVRYQGRPLTGMITDEAGRFNTVPLEPGSYAFLVTAPDYEDGTCTAEVQPPPATPPAGDKPPAAPPAGDAAPPAAPPAPPPASTDAAPGVTQLRCALKAKPKLGTAIVYAVDENNAGVPFAKVTAVDNLGRPLTIEADDQGGVAFANVPPGPLTIVVEAPNYFRASQKVTVEPKAEVRAEIVIVQRPKKSALNVTPTEIQLKSPIEFTPGTAQLLPTSRVVLLELADLLRTKTDIGPVEIQSHTDASTAPDMALGLTTQRANAVRDALVQNGVAATRLLAKGMGSTESKGPNTEAGKRKNNRIVLKIAKLGP